MLKVALCPEAPVTDPTEQAPMAGTVTSILDVGVAVAVNVIEPSEIFPPYNIIEDFETTITSVSTTVTKRLEIAIPLN